MLEVNDLKLEKRSFWFITRKHKGKDYFLKNFKESINGAYWTSDYTLATGYLDQMHAFGMKEDHFRDNTEVKVVEYKL